MLKWTIFPARKKRTVYAYYDTTPSGKLTQKRIHSYYEQRSVCAETENGTQRADIVLARIAKLLGEKAFQFSPC